MLNLSTTLVFYFHFLFIIQDSSGQTSRQLGLSTVLQPPGPGGQSTGNNLANILLASFDQRPSSTAQFSGYSSPQQGSIGSNTPPSGNVFGVPTFQNPDLNNPSNVRAQVSSFQVTNITTNPLGMLNLPFGERSTFGFTFFPSDESLFKKQNTNSYGQYGSYGSFQDQQSINEVQFTNEPSINIGSIVSDAFVLKERIDDIQSGNQIRSKRNGGSVITNIINNVFQQNTLRNLNVQNKENIHSPGDLIAQELPLNGTIDFTGLNNLTEFLIRETSKPRVMQRLNLAKQNTQDPMFVVMQFNTLGRQPVKIFDKGGERNARIHVVFGNKHFQFKSIEDLSQLDAQVETDSKSNPNVFGVPTSSEFGTIFNSNISPISQIRVDLVKEFVNYSWKVHQDVYEHAQRRSKDITDRLIALIEETNRNTTKFHPNRPFNQELPLDFATWPYVVSLAYRTLL